MATLSLILALPLTFLLGATPPSDAADKARDDLARRLRVDPTTVTLVSESPVTWTDGALGLHRPGELVTKALVAGTLITLHARNTDWIYTSGGNAIRFGGPRVEDASLLYLQQIDGEPNLNGNLVQVSLAGHNPRVLIPAVTEYAAFADGSILATRRTSRSGFDLLCLRPGTGEALRLGGALAYGAMAMDDQGRHWAAVQKTMLGSGWSVALGEVGGQVRSVDLPDGKVVRILWLEGSLRVQLESGWLELADGWQKTGAPFVPADHEFVLNKSQSLDARTETVDGKPVTKVAVVWFTGQEDPIAEVPGLELERCELIAGRWMLLTGVRAGEGVAVVVDVATGLVMPALQGDCQSVHGCRRSPAALLMI
ncbi:MAG: hypothetical protein IPM29_02405 [Planctomycetes bacterium]|nr:hypothetical protein [Planctomycetota bacterium]